MKRVLVSGLLALASCGPASSSSPFPEPYYQFTATDSSCMRSIVVDGLAQVWTENTCVAPGFKKTSYASGTEQSELSTDFGKLPSPPNSTCPQDTDPARSGGLSSGGAFPLGDGIMTSKVTLQWVTSKSTQTWVACQANDQFVTPYDAAVYVLTGQN
jgi:hypothetical protein